MFPPLPLESSATDTQRIKGISSLDKMIIITTKMKTTTTTATTATTATRATAAVVVNFTCQLDRAKGCPHR